MAIKMEKAVPIQAYVVPARALHWAIALLVLMVIPLGITMLRVPEGTTQNQLFDLHRSVGMTIFALAAFRVLVRVFNPPPPRTDAVPLWMWRAADAVHYALYALILAMPILGWVASNAFGAPVYYFGLFELPRIVGKDEPLSELIGKIHQVLGFVMAGLVVIHVGAGLWHGLVRRDGVLSRMLPSLDR